MKLYEMKPSLAELSNDEQLTCVIAYRELREQDLATKLIVTTTFTKSKKDPQEKALKLTPEQKKLLEALGLI